MAHVYLQNPHVLHLRCSSRDRVVLHRATSGIFLLFQHPGHLLASTSPGTGNDSLWLHLLRNISSKLEKVLDLTNWCESVPESEFRQEQLQAGWRNRRCQWQSEPSWSNDNNCTRLWNHIGAYVSSSASVNGILFWGLEVKNFSMGKTRTFEWNED